LESDSGSQAGRAGTDNQHVEWNGFLAGRGPVDQGIRQRRLMANWEYDAHECSSTMRVPAKYRAAIAVSWRMRTRLLPILILLTALAGALGTYWSPAWWFLIVLLPLTLLG